MPLPIFKIVPHDPKHLKEAEQMSSLLNAIYQQIMEGVLNTRAEGFGYEPPPYNPWIDPLKFSRHLKWQQFFRSRRIYVTT